MAAELPLGATPHDNAEFLLGTVAVTPIFLESDGSIDTQSQNWSAEEIDTVLANITTGVNWWSDALDQLGTVHTLDFVVDDTYARNPVPTGYEPIDRTSNHYSDYVGDFLTHAGVDSSFRLDDAMFEFNNSQREKFQTDWAFSIFIADSSDDIDGFFPSGGSFQGAFAFAGGLYIVSPSTRPMSTFAHEMGHIFWALDEYSGGGNYNESRGYYNTPNHNAWNNPKPGFEQQASIMAGYDLLVEAYSNDLSDASSLAMVGWQDSDGNGIFDVLDVPLNLEASGGLNPTTGKFDFTGQASAGTLPNLNTAGTQSDITINRISRLEVAIDGGSWASVAAPNTSTATFDLSVDVPANFATIAFRVIDAKTGVTSDTWTATATTPLIQSNRAAFGFAYFDTDADLSRSSGEPLLSDVTIRVTSADGSPLPQGNFDAADVAPSTVLTSIDGITLTGKVVPIDAEVQVRLASQLGDKPLFSVYDSQLQSWSTRLGKRVNINATFDDPTSYVEVDVVGLQNNRGAYARVEAFDAHGDLVTRATTDASNIEDGQLAFGQEQTLRLGDPNNSIASIRVLGQAGTLIGVSAVRTGVPAEITTDAHGAFSLADLPAGQYTFTPIANQVTHRFDPIKVTPTAGSSIEFAATQIDSPRFNVAMPHDVNGDGRVSAVDALQVINDLNRQGARTLTWSEALGNNIDVTNDGVISALDALRVINYLNQQETSPAAEEPLDEPMEGHQDYPVSSHREDSFDSQPSTDDPSTNNPPVNSIDEVFGEPIKWVSPIDDTWAEEATGLIFDNTSANQSSESE